MTIHNITSGAIRSGGARDPRKADGVGGEGDELQSPSQVEPVDRVEISEEGRALAQADAAHESRRPLPAERMSQIGRRLEDGTYHTGEVAEEVARRLIASGDL